MDQPEQERQEERPPVNHAEASPVCPYCGTDPLGITCRDIMFPNGLIALLAFCANPDCRKVLSVSFQGRANVQPQRIAAPGLIDRTLIDKIKKTN